LLPDYKCRARFLSQGGKKICGPGGKKLAAEKGGKISGESVKRGEVTVAVKK
jgi:hypothetical protein